MTTFYATLGFTLKDAGFDVVAAVDGRDALGKLNGVKVEIIITDLNMPNLNGIDLIKQVHRLPGTSSPLLSCRQRNLRNQKKRRQKPR